MSRRRPCLGHRNRCRNLTTDSSGRCDNCRRAFDSERNRQRDAGRPSPAARGYGAQHRRLRERWKNHIDSGEIVICGKPGCGLPIEPDQPFDLGTHQTAPIVDPSTAAATDEPQVPAATTASPRLQAALMPVLKRFLVIPKLQFDQDIYRRIQPRRREKKPGLNVTFGNPSQTRLEHNGGEHLGRGVSPRKSQELLLLQARSVVAPRRTHPSTAATTNSNSNSTGHTPNYPTRRERRTAGDPGRDWRGEQVEW
jgi:hypothetical protein